MSKLVFFQGTRTDLHIELTSQDAETLLTLLKQELKVITWQSPYGNAVLTKLYHHELTAVLSGAWDESVTGSPSLETLLYSYGSVAFVYE